MQHLIQATRDAVAQRNWYAALTLALTMPDICGRLENPKSKSQQRFRDWYDRYLLHKYQRQAGPMADLQTFLCASDCYALRCAFLHQGEFDLEGQQAQQVLTHFRFTAPHPFILMHNNRMNEALQLQVDIFCEDVCESVEQWLADVAEDPAIQGRMTELGRIV